VIIPDVNLLVYAYKSDAHISALVKSSPM